MLGVPAVIWLTKLIRPAKPEEEAIHRGVEEARRRIDKFPHWDEPRPSRLRDIDNTPPMYYNCGYFDGRFV